MSLQDNTNPKLFTRPGLTLSRQVTHHQARSHTIRTGLTPSQVSHQARSHTIRPVSNYQTRSHTIRPGHTLSGQVSYNQAKSHTIRPGLTLSGQVSNYQARCHTIRPGLKLSGQVSNYQARCHTISHYQAFIGKNTIKFLGLLIKIPHDSSESRTEVLQKLDERLKLVDQCPETRPRNPLYRLGICPRLNWPQTSTNFPVMYTCASIFNVPDHSMCIRKTSQPLLKSYAQFHTVKSNSSSSLRRLHLTLPY